MHLAIASLASTIFQTLLSLQGLSIDTHPHARELVRPRMSIHLYHVSGCFASYPVNMKSTKQARLDAYKRKISKIESKKWLQEHRPSLSVDVAGANRFISAAIPELSKEQKQALRMVALRLLQIHLMALSICLLLSTT